MINCTNVYLTLSFHQKKYVINIPISGEHLQMTTLVANIVVTNFFLLDIMTTYS